MELPQGCTAGRRRPHAVGTQTRHILISGRVQGVGFRDALLTQALQAGVRGWVRNRRDGRVEAVLQGDESQVAEVIAWSRRGPPLAHVLEIEVADAAADAVREYRGFDRLPTA
jgi:acylphosphatase